MYLRVRSEERAVRSGMERDSAMLGNSARSVSRSCSVMRGSAVSKLSGGIVAKLGGRSSIPWTASTLS